MSETDITQQTNLEGIASNAFGEHYLFGINRTAFQNTDASTVFRSYYGDTLFEEDTFYLIGGTDSGLLYRYVKSQGIPKGSRYLFVELTQVLALLQGLESPPNDGSATEMSVVNDKNWFQQAQALEIKKYAALKSVVPLRSLGVVHGHFSAYLPFWRELKKDFDTFIWNQENVINSRRFTHCQIENLAENQIPAICLKNTFRGKTAVVLGGGPSLDELLPWVQQHRENLLVIAVSRISNSLLQANIQPDIVVSIDPHPINLSVCQDMLEFQNGTLFVNDFHLSSNLLASWGGQKVFTGPRYPWSTQLEPENLPIAKGTTVTNSCMTLAVELGVAQIVFGGVDFCFSQQGYTHASGSTERTMGPMLQFSDQQIKTNSGIMADTMHDFIESAIPLDNLARDAIGWGCRTINPAPGAMRLAHVEHIPVDKILITPMEKPAHEIIANNVPISDSNNRIRHCKEVIGEIDRILTELKSIKKLSSTALDHNRKLFAKDEAGAGLHNKEKVERIEEQLNQKYEGTTAFMRQFGIHRFIPILRLDDDRYVEDLEESCRLYHQAMVDTSSELTDVLRQARTRTMTRAEEDKPQPNLKRLLEQWQHDQQPGRAIQWAKKHSTFVKQLSEPQQQKLQEYINTFGTIVAQLRRLYIARTERGIVLDGTVCRAREYFQTKEQAGLIRLQTSLQKHHDKKQAALFIPLVQGYLAELNGELEKAIAAYSNTTEGPAYIDALTRLFELNANSENWPSTLEALKNLSKISSIYAPMYADVLHATGDTDTAIETYTDYILANPDDLNTVMKLGKLYEQSGSADGVSMMMSYILDKDPQNQTAKTMLASLEKSQANGE